MTPSDVRKALDRIDDAGPPDARRRQREHEQVVATTLLDELAAKRRGCTKEYRRFVEAWLGKALSEQAPIVALANEGHYARRYFTAGLIAIAVECGLSWWTFETCWGTPGLYGALVAAASALMPAILGAWYEIGSTSRPRESLRRLRQGPLRIGGIGLLMGIVTGIVARCVEGTTALSLPQFFNVGLAIATDSLLIITGALFCAAAIHSTSARLARRYDEVDQKYRRTVAFLAMIAAPPTPPRRCRRIGFAANDDDATGAAADRSSAHLRTPPASRGTAPAQYSRCEAHLFRGIALAPHGRCALLWLDAIPPPPPGRSEASPLGTPPPPAAPA